jgi:protein-S-isoprenylcysteine O-methyltransferase Ste14
MPIARAKHPPTDWAGFIFFLSMTLMNLAVGISVFRRTAAIAIFLIPTFLHDAIITVAFLLRKPLRQQIQGWKPRAAAYIATFLIPGFAFLTSHWGLPWMKPSAAPLFLAGVVMWIVGAYLVAWSLFHLRSAFSIVPQARTLITSGPYRLARHPVYTGYVLQYGGLTLAYLTPALWAVFLVWWAVLMLRISYEETVLSAAFPEYEAYKRRVGRFMPRILSRPEPEPQKPGDCAGAKGSAAGTSPTNLKFSMNLSGD